ncbi:hypothetical protein [Neisseria sicca]
MFADSTAIVADAGMSDFLVAGAEHPQLHHRTRAALRRQMPFPGLIPQSFVFSPQ